MSSTFSPLTLMKLYFLLFAGCYKRRLSRQRKLVPKMQKPSMQLRLTLWVSLIFQRMSMMQWWTRSMQMIRCLLKIQQMPHLIDYLHCICHMWGGGEFTKVLTLPKQTLVRPASYNSNDAKINKILHRRYSQHNKSSGHNWNYQKNNQKWWHNKDRKAWNNNDSKLWQNKDKKPW